jgi:hypothetical protein
MESSYEYAKTLSVAEKLVYDIRAYGGPATEGKFAIIRRAADNKPDTIVKGDRKGIFVDALLTRLNKTHAAEIVIVTRNADSSAASNLMVYAINNTGDLSPVKYDRDLGEMMGGIGRDSFYVEGNELIRRHNNKWLIHYQMKNAELKKENSSSIETTKK